MTCLQIKNINVVKDTGLVEVGGARILLKFIAGVSYDAESSSSEIYNVIIRYKNTNHDKFRMNREAFAELLYIYTRFLETEELNSQKERIQKEGNKLKNEEEKRKENKLKLSTKRILLAILVFQMLIFGVGVKQAFGSELNEVQNQNPKNFPYTYIYDVNIDKCVTTEYYKHKFKETDLKNPKLVAELPQRPGELTLVLQNGEMFVFLLNEDSCKAYRKHFFEDMNRQNLKEDEKYKSSDIDKD